MGSRAVGRFGVVAGGCALIALSAAAFAQAKGTAYFVGNFSTPNIDARAIAADGSLTPLGTAPIGGTPRSIALTPNAKFAYATNFFDGKVLAYDVGITGALTLNAGQPAGGYPVGTQPEALATSPDGKFLFVANTGIGSISAFSVDAAGVLTPVNNSPFGAGGLAAIAVSANGQFLYATLGNTVQAYSITNGALAPVGAAVPAGTNPKGIAVTPSNSHVVVLDNAAPFGIRTFAIGADGTLGAAGAPAPAAAAPDTLAVSQDGQFVYVANGSAAGSVSAYKIGADGSLTAVPNQPFAAGALSRGLDAGPGGRVYVGDYVDPVAGFSTASVFDSGADGALAPVPNSPFTLAVRGVEFQSVAVTPNQGPTAAIAATAAPAGSPTTLSAAGSADSDGGSIAEHNWDFGDGDSQGSGGESLTHVYAQPGTYTATVTVVDDEGCSTTTIFTGQTADCNGNPAATATTQVVVPAGAVELKLSGKKTQKLDDAIEVGAACDLDCTAAGRGKLIVSTPAGGGGRTAAKVSRKTFKIKKVSKAVSAGGKTTLKLKLSKKARKAATKALNNGGKVTAKLTITATTASGNTDTAKRTVKLVKKR